MSLGFGVGDFFAAFKLANKLRKRFINAPSEFRALAEDVKQLSSVLRDIDDLDPTDELDGRQKQRLNEGPHLSSLNSVQALLKAGSDINAVNFWGQTPLLYASMYGNPQATRLLLAADADTSIMDKTGRTAMCYAVELGHMDIILQLLEHERKTPETDSTIKDAAFVRAAINGHGDMVKSLRRGMSSTPTDTTAFLTAAATAMVKDTMIPPLPQGSGPPWTSLHEEFLQKMLIWAAKEGCTETVEALLSRPDVDPNKPGTTDSRTPLECAVEGRHETIVDLLLRRNV